MQRESQTALNRQALNQLGWHHLVEVDIFINLVGHVAIGIEVGGTIEQHATRPTVFLNVSKLHLTQNLRFVDGLPR